MHSVADALRSVPGLTVVSTGGLGATTGVFPRGGESNYTLVLIDGVPANAFGGDYDFGHLPAANIDRVEIVRGPQSALFGANAIGSVVRVVSQRGGAPTGQFLVEAGAYDTSRVSGSTAGSYRAFEWGGYFDQLLSDGMNGEPTASGDVVGNDDYTQRSAAASLGWRSSASWLRGDARYTADERGFPGPFGSNPIGAYEGIDLVSRGENARTQAGVAWSSQLTARVRLQAQTDYNQIDSDFVSPFDASDSYSRRWTAACSPTSRVLQGFDLSAGMELQRERTGSTYITGATAQEIPIVRAIEGYFVEGPVDLARTAVRDRGVCVGGHPARPASKNPPCRRSRPSAAAGRLGRLGQPAARRRPGWLARRAPTTREFAARSARASGRPTASSSRSRTIPA